MKDINGMPIKGNGDDGDSMLWSGLMVAVGDTRPIAGIRMCQSEDGRIWRSPNRVNNQAQNSFSRDMSLGFILYFQKTQDHEMADKWISYIKKTGSLFPKEESTDTRHLITPSVWWLMSYAGMRVPMGWRLTRWLYRPWHKLELMLAPRGFQTHLQAVSQLILNIHDGKLDTDIGKKLWDKEQNNAFFAYLAGATHNANSINTQLRAMHSLSPGDGSQWCWERSDEEEAWRDSCGWDFEFIDRLTTLGL